MIEFARIVAFLVIYYHWKNVHDEGVSAVAILL